MAKRVADTCLSPDQNYDDADATEEACIINRDVKFVFSKFTF